MQKGRFSGIGKFAALLISVVLLEVAAPANVYAQSAPADQGAVSNFTTRCAATGAPEERQVSFRTLAPDLACGQLRIWSFPVNLAKGRGVIPTVGVAGVTATLIVTDPSSARYFRRSTDWNRFNSMLPGGYTKYGLITLPVGFYALSLIRSDSYGKQTAMLAGEALLQAAALTSLSKTITGRRGPASISRNGRDTWFQTRDGSFPSSHASSAFAIATVFASRYRHHKWVPYVAYGAAGAIGLASATSGAHFSSEVFLGAALGYSTARFAVLR